MKQKDEEQIKRIVELVATKRPDMSKEDIAKSIQEIFIVSDRVVDKLIKTQWACLAEEEQKGYSEYVQFYTFLNITECFFQGNMALFLTSFPNVDIDAIELKINENLKRFFDTIREERDGQKFLNKEDKGGKI